MADLYNGFNDGIGDPGAGRDTSNFYAFDAKSHANAINALRHVDSIASSATPSINLDTCNQFNITAQAVPITSMSTNLTGGTDGKRIAVRIKDNGVPQAIVWGAKWRAVGVMLPAITIPGSTMYVEGRWNAADAVVDVDMVRKQLIPMQVFNGNAAQAASVAIPAHQLGDVILIFAFNNASTTIPAPPSAGGTVPAWAQIDPGTGNGCAAATYQFVATANNHTSGTWTNTTHMEAIVVRGADPTNPIGAHQIAAIATSSTQAVSGTITPQKTDGSSAFLYFFGHRILTAWGAAPAGTTQIAAGASTGGVCCDSKTDTTSDGSITQLLTSPTGTTSIMGAVLEILAAT